MKERSLDGSLAFLCACETTMGDRNLPDEAMNLGASLLSAVLLLLCGKSNCR
jgi:hypothetical protein